MTRSIHHDFDPARWEKSRRDRADRIDRQEAQRLVGLRMVERVCKPGKWRVFRDDANVVTEIFGDNK